MQRYFYTFWIILSGLVGFGGRLQAREPFCVVLDAGHGGKDPGCVSRYSKLFEKDINLAVTLILGNMIEKVYDDVKVVYTRNKDKFIPLDERANIANRVKADLFISIHTNTARRGNASGTETFTLGLDKSAENLEVAKRENAVILMEDDYLQKYEGFDPNSSESYIIFELMQNKHLEQSITLASEIQNSFAAANRRNRGVKQAGFLVLRKTSMPAVLIELGFISNRDEEKFMASNEGRIELAKSIFSAFSTFKNDYDRKNGDNRETNEIIYKIQILMSDKIIPENSPKFKGYDEISYYREGNYYKYTYGSTADFKQILDMYRHAAVDFKGCFIIKTKDGKRIK